MPIDLTSPDHGRPSFDTMTKPPFQGRGVTMEKREYEPPTFEIYGTLTELTEHGRTNPGQDWVVYKDGTRGSKGGGTPGDN